VNEAPLLDRLRSDPDHAEWYEPLNAAEPAPGAKWPGTAAFDEFLEIAAVPEEDRPIVRDLLPVVGADPDLRWIVERYAGLLAARIGVPGYEPLPLLPEDAGEIRRHLFTFVYAAHLPLTLAYHRAHHVPEEITRATLADIGRHYLLEHIAYDRSGLGGGERWFPLHARGLIYQLGRLQFEISPLEDVSHEAITAAGHPAQAGELSLSVHIPSLMGPMTPEACDASFAQARTFFATHFPDQPVRYATCDSWLLDGQLANYLPAESNIVQFQRRFRPAGDGEPGNNDILNFVFRSPGTPIDELPQRTTLERAVVQHIRDGHTWRVRNGWLPLDEGSAGPLADG
jgi:hypothetical protein